MTFLSIQSFVCHGFVGNRVSLFVLQLLEFEVDSINTVHISNHTGYPSFRGQCLNSSQIDDIFKGLEDNGLLNYTHMLTGYIGSVSLLKSLVKHTESIKEKSSNIFILIDPVMGDDNKLYVPHEFLDIYRDFLIPLSDCITPNQFEAELLSNSKITDFHSAITVISALHLLGPRNVVISSIIFPNDPSIIIILASDGKTMRKWLVPKFPGYFSGVGDLLSALIIAWIAKGLSLYDSTERSINTVFSVIRRTVRNSNENSSISRELDIVHSKRDIENPTIEFSSSAV